MAEPKLGDQRDMIKVEISNGKTSTPKQTEEATSNGGPAKSVPVYVWILVAVAVAAAITFAVAFGVTYTRWSHSDPPQAVPQACQFLGIKVGTLIQAIDATSNCGGSPRACYNMTANQMETYVGTPPFVSLNPNFFSCIDGRHDDEIIATPAGDMGVFLSGAAIFISTSTTPTDYSYNRIQQLLHDFILKFRTTDNQFYYHTDSHAVDRVVAALGGATALSTMVTDPNFQPPAGQTNALLAALSNISIGIGCGHVKYMGQFPSDYGISTSDLVVNAVQAVWTLKWGGLRDYIQIEELMHDHAEQAVLSITDIEGCPGMAPIITQRDPNDDSAFYTQQIFINHEAAVKPFRQQVSEWFLSLPGAATMTTDAFDSKLNDLATLQLMQSANHLAANRPLFNATVYGRLFTPPH